MRIAVIGAGPAGLYFAISMKLRDPAHDIHVFERNRRGETFGWGVVFSDQTLGNLELNDPASAAAIAGEFAHWDDIAVHIRQPMIAPLVAERQPPVVDAEAVQHGGVQVVDVDGIARDVVGKVVGLAVTHAGLDAAAG